MSWCNGVSGVVWTCTASCLSVLEAHTAVRSRGVVSARPNGVAWRCFCSPQEHTLSKLASIDSSSSIAYDVTVSVIRDIHVMSCAERFVGTCLSQVSRLAAELMYARGRQVDPPVGLDHDSCRRFPSHSYAIPLDWRGWFDVWAA